MPAGRLTQRLAQWVNRFPLPAYAIAHNELTKQFADKYVEPIATQLA